MSAEPEYVGTARMAQLLGVTPATVRSMFHNGTIRGYRLGAGRTALIRFRPEEVREDIRAHNERK